MESVREHGGTAQVPAQQHHRPSGTRTLLAAGGVAAAVACALLVLATVDVLPRDGWAAAPPLVLTGFVAVAAMVVLVRRKASEDLGTVVAELQRISHGDLRVELAATDGQAGAGHRCRDIVALLAALLTAAEDAADELGDGGGR